MEVCLRVAVERVPAIVIDSTVIELDVLYPTDAGLAAHGVRALAREGRKLAALVKEQRPRVRDRSRSIGRTPRALTRTISRRLGQAQSELLKLTAKTGELLKQSIAETRRLVVIARRRVRGRGAKAELRASRSKTGSCRSARSPSLCPLISERAFPACGSTPPHARHAPLELRVVLPHVGVDHLRPRRDFCLYDREARSACDRRVADLERGGLGRLLPNVRARYPRTFRSEAKRTAVARPVPEPAR